MRNSCVTAKLAGGGKRRYRSMHALKQRYVVDSKGRRIGVLLRIADYHRLLNELEELDSIRAFDAAKAAPSKVRPFEDAVARIERKS